MIPTTLLTAMLLAASPAAGSDCAPLPGAEALLASPATRWIVVGEVHGTAETPAAFAELACLASAKRPVVVAVEQPVPTQAAIDAYVGSDGGEQAKSLFLKSIIWHFSMKDGRSSQAVFALFERLRALHAAGRVERVIAFQPASPPGPDGYEAQMAKILVALSPPGRLVLALVGNVHAMRGTVSWASPPYRAMASYLPPDASLTLNAVPGNGTAWNCQAGGCGPHPVSGPAEPLAIMLDGKAGDPYSGVIRLGASTASPPQGSE